MGFNHARVVLSSAAAELVAVVDPVADEELVRSVVPVEVPLLRSVDALYRDRRVDAVHIVTPPDTHVALAEEALQQGCHVYVEKPFALRKEDAQRLVSQAQTKGRVLCSGHQLLCHPALNTGLDILPKLGRVRHVDSYFSFRPARRISAVDQLIDILPHPVYVLLHALERAEPGHFPVLVAAEVEADGEVRALIRQGGCTAFLTVSLNGRPVESYCRIIAEHGSVCTDLILAGVTKHFGSGATAVSAVIKPYSEAWQRLTQTTANLLRMLFGKRGGYEGLAELAEAFYEAALGQGMVPMSPESIVATTAMCEYIVDQVRAADQAEVNVAAQRLEQAEASLAQPHLGCVLLTGATGFLGRRVAAELRGAGWAVRATARRPVPVSRRVPGVEYVTTDLGVQVPPEHLEGVDAIVHLAAETAGGWADHERNSVKATGNLLEAACAAGVRRFLNISSVAVIQPGKGRARTEDSPVEADNRGRGPYVWAKVKAEALVSETRQAGRINGKTIRLGPLVDFDSFSPPGRLGREVGPWYVAVGSKRDRLGVCDVGFAAEVIRRYLADFDEAPSLLNLLQPEAPTREELAQRFLDERPDLKRLWIPDWVLKGLSALAKGVMRLRRPGIPPLDIYAAFASETYDTRRLTAFLDRSRATEHEGGAETETVSAAR